MSTEIEKDVFEDRPFPDGISMTDWTGMAWREIPPERVEYLMNAGTKRGKIVAFLSQVPAGEGRKRDNLPDFKSANSVRNALYRAAGKLWGAKSIKVAITKNEENGTYQVEFVHLSPENKNSGSLNAGKPKAQKEEEQPKDELHALCLKYAAQTITGTELYNLLKQGGINTVEDLMTTSMDDIAEIRRVGATKLAVIAKMKELKR